MTAPRSTPNAPVRAPRARGRGRAPRATGVGLGLVLLLAPAHPGALGHARPAPAPDVGRDAPRAPVRQDPPEVPGRRPPDSGSTPELEDGAPRGAEELRLPGTRDRAVRAAVRSALDHLAEQQAVLRDGSLPATPGQQHSPVGVTALGALAFMAGGSTPNRGPHAGALTRCLEYLLNHQVPEGDERVGWIGAPEDQQSRSHGHGLATLALSQAYTLSPRSPLGRRIGDALVLAVRRIEAMQGVEGGWYYEPLRSTEHEGSVTVCLVQALRGARNVGVQVAPGVVERAVEYVRKLQDDTGGFQYSFTQPETSVALTGACLSTLHSIGVYEGREVDEGYDYVWRELSARRDDEARGLFASQPAFPYYERFYLSQALWQHPDPEVFRGWAESEVRRVLTSQRADGAWEDVRHDGRGGRVEGRYGTCYATAMNVLFLSVPEGLLPIFRR